MTLLSKISSYCVFNHNIKHFTSILGEEQKIFVVAVRLVADQQDVAGKNSLQNMNEIKV